MGMNFKEKLENGVIRLDDSKLKVDITRQMDNKEQESMSQVMLKTEPGTNIEEFAAEFMKLKKEGLNFIATFNDMDFDSSFYSSEEIIVEAYKKHIRENRTAIEVEETQQEVVENDESQKEVDEDVKEQEEKEEESQEEQTLTEEEKTKIDEARITYYDAIIALHEKRMQTISKQVANHKLVSSDEDYNEELNLEVEMYVARDAYLSLNQEDPYTKIRTQFIKEEKEAKEQIEMTLRNKAERFRKIEQEISEIDKREQEINEQLLSKDINETQIEALTKELADLGEKRKNLELELAEVKDELDNAIETRRSRMLRHSGLAQKHVSTLNTSDKRDYAYQQSKISVMNNNFDQATKLHYENIKRRIEEREQKIKDIEKELKKLPKTDFEKRLLLLNELDKETNMLEADREAKSELDRGIIPDSVTMQKDAQEKADVEEYRQEEFDKSTKEARIVAKEQKEKIGQDVVENPEEANMEEKDRNATLAAAAVTMAVVGDSIAPEVAPEEPIEEVKPYVIASCVLPELNDLRKDLTEDEEGRKNAEEYLEQDEQLKAAHEELNRVEESIEKNV